MTATLEKASHWVGQENWPEAAKALGPIIASYQKDIDLLGALPGKLLEELYAAKLFRILLPRSFGGGEASPISFARTVEELARADASTAWCVGQAAGCSFSAAYLDPATAHEIFSDSRAVVAWGPGTHHSRAIAVDGGYRVTGSWSYASGSRHATWLGAHCAVFNSEGSRQLDDSGKPIEKTVLFRRSAAEIIDVWQVMGLKGTGSDDYALNDFFISEQFAYERDSYHDRREKGPLYQLGILTTYGMAFASVGLGIAESMLDDFVDLASQKTAKGASKALRESAVVQAMVGKSEAKLRAARAFLYSTIESMWNALLNGNKLSLEQRMTFRLAATHAIRESCETVEEIYSSAGATAIFESRGFERKFRDMHAVSQQIQGQARNYETVGQIVLGLGGDNPRI